MQHAARWKFPFHTAAALGIKVAAVDRKGAMLAIANCTTHLPVEYHALERYKWHEFIAPGDLPGVLAYFAEAPDIPSRPISYRQMASDGARMVQAMGRVTITKLWVGDAWLCYGDMELTPDGTLNPKEASAVMELVSAALECGIAECDEHHQLLVSAFVKLRELAVVPEPSV